MMIKMLIDQGHGNKNKETQIKIYSPLIFVSHKPHTVLSIYFFSQGTDVFFTMQNNGHNLRTPPTTVVLPVLAHEGNRCLCAKDFLLDMQNIPKRGQVHQSYISIDSSFALFQINANDIQMQGLCLFRTPKIAN